MNEPEEALKLLQWALKIYRNLPGQQSRCSNGGASGVYSNRAGTYNALGRTNIDAIEILGYVVGIRVETFRTANSEGKKRRLTELLKEEGRVRNRKRRSLETFLDTNLQLS
ncbi:hypothetical protein RHMOL_Rhmol03G0017900 [Rhododendron molle]|uniref:Uncharacterized protein n=1 Tax=Rhododendron molle TaxID=49168 RepID=A0ACC0P997_RHOML|nr:hypothetical protein RHMOL_Rhmol03G0017900 [Rhododendron molle]